MISGCRAAAWRLQKENNRGLTLRSERRREAVLARPGPPKAEGRYLSQLVKEWSESPTGPCVSRGCAVEDSVTLTERCERILPGRRAAPLHSSFPEIRTGRERIPYNGDHRH